MEPMAKVGRVIAVAGSLETLLELHGASGTGLREKTESLRGKLPPEALELSRRVGIVRNRVAHEPETLLTDEELLQYEETARELARLIEGADPEPVPPSLPAAPGQPEKPAAGEDDGGTREAARSVSDAPAEPPRVSGVREPKHSFRLPPACRALIPGVHLFVLGRLLLSSLLPGWWYWVLLLTLPLSGGTGWYYWRHRATLEKYWFWLAAGWLAAGWIGTAVTALVERKEHPRLAKTAYFPVVHAYYLAVRIGQSIRYGLLLAALTGLAAQAAAIYLVYQAVPEWTAALVLTGGSLLAAFLLAWKHQG